MKLTVSDLLSTYQVKRDMLPFIYVILILNSGAYAQDLNTAFKGLDLSIEYFISRIKTLEQQIKDL